MKKYRTEKQVQVGRGGVKNVVDGDEYRGDYWKIFNIKLFSRDNKRVLNVLEEKLASGTRKYWVATVNPEFVMVSTKDSDFKGILKKTNLNVIDGIGLVWARELNLRLLALNNKKTIFTKLLIGFKVGLEVLRGKHRGQVSSGADLIKDLVKMAKKMNKKVYLLGGWGDRAEKSAKYLMSKYLLPEKLIRWCEGEPGISNDEVIKKINSYKPDILLVAYGMKKQEVWINNNLKNLEAGLVMGVGRSFDYYSGELKRAPDWIRKIGMEWLYSLIKEPKRIKRQLVLPKFICKVLTD